VPPEESLAYEVYAEPAVSEVMRETLAWHREHLPAQL
jgi:hypothetical protein